MFNLKGRVAVITGGSSGLGLQMAKGFAAQGASLALLARREEKLQEAVTDIKSEYGIDCMYAVCSVSEQEEVDAAVAKVLEHFGRVDILINNAGAGSVAPLEDLAEEDWNHVIDIDLTGVFRTTQAFGRHMIEQKYGRIINIASIYGLVGNMALPSAVYHTAKGGVVNFTRAIAAEWARHNITVNAICPGYFETEMTKETLETDSFHDYMRQSVPLLRYGRAGELNAAAVFFASDEASYVTGTILPVDGGYTCV